MGTKYHKIQSLYKRDRVTKQFTTEFSRPEFEYLYGLQWTGFEKINGTNIRIIWNMTILDDDPRVEIEGRGDNSQIPTGLLKKLQEMFPVEKMLKVFDRPGFESPVILYGEGVGPKIQAGERNSKDFDFILFDIRIGRWWLLQDDVSNIAKSMGLKRAPEIFDGNLGNAEIAVQCGFPSRIADDFTLPAEGLVLRPKLDLFARNGDRIITKLKTKDYLETT